MRLAKTLVDSYTAHRQELLESEWATKPLAELGGKTPVQCVEELSAPEDWMAFLIEWGQRTGRPELPVPLWRVAVARTADDDTLAPRLIALMENGEFGSGPAGVLAIRLLGEARAPQAAPSLVRLLERLDEFSERGQAVFEALEQMGDVAREALCDLCERYRGDVESGPFSQAVEALTRLPKDDRTWRYLRQALEEARTRRMQGLYWAMAGDYGDRRALAYLNGALEERQDLSPDERRDILESIELCGGVPTELALAQGKRPAAPSQPAGKVGRNDPCPCGSGLKYKKCCGK